MKKHLLNFIEKQNDNDKADFSKSKKKFQRNLERTRVLVDIHLEPPTKASRLYFVFSSYLLQCIGNIILYIKLVCQGITNS